MLGFVVGLVGFRVPSKQQHNHDLHKFVVFRKELCSDDVPVLAWQLEAGRSYRRGSLGVSVKGSITVVVLHPQCERLCAGPLPSISNL